MKYIIIRGNHHSGKATTIKEVCRQIKPVAAYHVNISNTGASLSPVSIRKEFCEHTYLMLVGEKRLLVLPESPSSQRVSISRIITALEEMKLTIDVAIIAINTQERVKGVSTRQELEQYGSCIYELKIKWIPSHHFAITQEWLNRIEYVVATVDRYL